MWAKHVGGERGGGGRCDPSSQVGDGVFDCVCRLGATQVRWGKTLLMEVKNRGL